MERLPDPRSAFERPSYPNERSELRGENVRAYVEIADAVGYLALFAIDLPGSTAEGSYETGRVGLARRA